MTLSQLKEKYPNYEEYIDRWLEDDEEFVIFTEWHFSTKETFCFCRSINGDTTKLHFAGRFEGGKGSGCVGPEDALPEWVCEFVKGISEKL